MARIISDELADNLVNILLKMPEVSAFYSLVSSRKVPDGPLPEQGAESRGDGEVGANG